MKKKNIIIIILILSISIGFAILSSSLSIGSNITIADASFDVHFDDVEKVDSSIENDTYSLSNSNTTLSLSVPLDKPGDYVDYKLYVVNGGTIDAALDSITVTIPQAAQDYITYTLTYYNGNTISSGDLLKRGTNKPLKLHIEYKYNIDDFIDLSSTTVTVSISYKQPQTTNKYVWNFDYEGAEQTFTVPKTGTYKLEVWGARGGSDLNAGNYGGYSTGTISLTKDDILYLNIGGAGTMGCDEVVGYRILITGGYNGGGNAITWVDNKCSGSGGGATHIATASGLLSSLNGNRSSIIIVAGGGGGGAYISGSYGGSGGGYQGTSGYASYGEFYAFGGTQLAGGANSSVGGALARDSATFGQGASALFMSNINSSGNTSGGGGGYYGGGAGTGQGGIGGGGSGYIGNTDLSDKIMYCYKCQSSENEADETHIKTRSTTNVSETPTSNYAKIGNGYAKITYIG